MTKEVTPKERNTQLGKSAAERLLRWAFIQLAMKATGINLSTSGDIPEGQFISGLAPHTSQVDNLIYFKALQQRGITVDQVAMLAKQVYWQGWRQPIADMMLGKTYLVNMGEAMSIRQVISDLRANPDLILGLYVQSGRDPSMSKPVESGFSYLSAVSGIPIVPVALLGVDQIMPPGEFWSSLEAGIMRTLTLNPQEVQLHWLEPINPHDFSGKTKDKMPLIEMEFIKQMNKFYLDKGLEVPKFLKN